MPRTRKRPADTPPTEGPISIIAPGMTVVGDLSTDGCIRVEGRVEGSVRAGQAVVVGREGVLEGDLHARDAVVSGRVSGCVVAEARLEVQATARIQGEVRAVRMQLEDGAVLNGAVRMGADALARPAAAGPRALGAPSEPPRAAAS